MVTIAEQAQAVSPDLACYISTIGRIKQLNELILTLDVSAKILRAEDGEPDAVETLLGVRDHLLDELEIQKYHANLHGTATGLGETDIPDDLSELDPGQDSAP